MTAPDRGESLQSSGGLPGPRLRVEGLDVYYGSSQALSNVCFEVPSGSVVAVLGVNGAGKSTLGRALSGLVPASSGIVELDGAELTGVPPHSIRRRGLAYVPEGRGIFPGLSVRDNIWSAMTALKGRARKRAALEYAFGLFPILAQRNDQQAGTLSGGEQQMLALARALCVSPKVLIADELSLGLAPKIVDSVFQTLERARTAGITVMIIEQFVHRALALADACIVLRRGQVVWSGPAGEAADEVLARYLGETGADG